MNGWVLNMYATIWQWLLWIIVKICLWATRVKSVDPAPRPISWIYMDQSQAATSVIESLLTGMTRLCLLRPWRAVGAGAEPTFRPPFWNLGGGAGTLVRCTRQLFLQNKSVTGSVASVRWRLVIVNENALGFQLVSIDISIFTLRSQEQDLIEEIKINEAFPLVCNYYLFILWDTGNINITTVRTLRSER